MQKQADSEQSTLEEGAIGVIADLGELVREDDSGEKTEQEQTPNPES